MNPYKFDSARMPLYSQSAVIVGWSQSTRAQNIMFGLLWSILWVSSLQQLTFMMIFIPTFFKAKGILLSPGSAHPSIFLSVCLLCCLLLNHWMKYNQIWCVSYSHECGVQIKSNQFIPLRLHNYNSIRSSIHNVTHRLLWRHCDSKSFTVVWVGGQR